MKLDSIRMNQIMLEILTTYARQDPESLAERCDSPAGADEMKRILRGVLRSCFQSLGKEVTEDEAHAWYRGWLDSPLPIVSFHIAPPGVSFGGTRYQSNDYVQVESCPPQASAVKILSDSLLGLGFLLAPDQTDGWRIKITGGETLVFLMPLGTSKKARQALVRKTAALLASLGYGYEGATKWTERRN